MSKFHRKALFAAILAGLGAVGGNVVVRKKEESVLSPEYTSYKGNYWDPVPKAKHRSTKGGQRKRKKSKNRPQKHRVKKKSKR